MVFSPVATSPAEISIMSNQWFFNSLRLQTLITGLMSRPYGFRVRHEYLKANTAGNLARSARRCRWPGLLRRSGRAWSASEPGKVLPRSGWYRSLRYFPLLSLYDVCKSACLVARSRVCVTAYAALCKVLVVPFHLFCQTVTGMGIRAACCLACERRHEPR